MIISVWRSCKSFSIVFLFLGCFVVCRLWALVCCFSSFDGVHIRFWWWSMVVIVFHVVWWRCIYAVAREMEWLTWWGDKRKAMSEAKDLSLTLCLKPSRVAINSQMCLGIFWGNDYRKSSLCDNNCLRFNMLEFCFVIKNFSLREEYLLLMGAPMEF